MLKDHQKVAQVEEVIDELVFKGLVALEEMEAFNQVQVDRIVTAMALAAQESTEALAKHAFEETGRGVYDDKVIKNTFAAENVYQSIIDQKTAGVITVDQEKGLREIAAPVGVVCGVTPTTNPTSTTIFKSLIALKTRNPIIFAFHPSAQQSSAAAARVVRDAAIKAGAPENCIQWVETPSLEATSALMNHSGVAIVLATGGGAMVKAAYSTGKPALGVGPGNTPAYIEKTANIKRAVADVFLSKTFDNGMICASEQGVIVDEKIYAEVKAEFANHPVYFVKAEELELLEEVVMNANKTAVNPQIVGNDATKIAELAGISVPAETKMLIAELPGTGAEYPLSLEKLSPVLAMVKAKNLEAAFDLSERMLETGLGHTAVIHTEDEDLQIAFALKMKACRILINQPATHGAIGDLYNEIMPSLTLGCGSYGKNSVSKNVTASNLLNIKTVASRTKG